MDLKKLEYLEAIYRHRNFTKAAEEQYISQPSMSSAIQSLETELDVTLINRNTRPLSFTEAGEEFMEYVQRILKEIKTSEAAMKKHSKQNHDKLNIAIYSSSFSQLLPKIYMDFHNLFPQCTLHITEATLTTMLQELLSEELDMAYTLIPDDYDRKNFRVIPLESCELRVILSAQHRLAKEPAISLAQLQSERIYAYPQGSLIRQKLEQQQKLEKVSLNFTVPSRFDFVKFLVAQNQGVFFILHDKFHELPFDSGIISKPLKTPLIFQTGLIFKQGIRMTNSMKSMKTYLEQLH